MPVRCYICGREFGTKSISIHIPQCKRKWDNEQKKLPKGDRRPVPDEPENFAKILAGELTDDEIRQYNDQAFDDFNKKSLEKCPNCGRTFVPRALEIHLRSCKPKDDVALTNNSGAKKTSSVKKPPSEEKPTRTELISFIRRENVFDSVDVRQELLKILNEFKAKS